MRIIIRKFEKRDAPEAHEMIVRTLQEVSAEEYPPKIIERLINAYSIENLTASAEHMDFYVAVDKKLENKPIVGTAVRDGCIVKAMFVAPEYIKKGIGAMLMRYVEARARADGIKKLEVSSSKRAYEFYRKRGYARVEKKLGSIGIPMEKNL